MPLDQYQLLQIALKIGAALGVFLLGRFLAHRTRVKLSEKLAKTTIAPSMVRLLILAAYYGILLVTVILALALIGFPIEALLAASLVIVVILGIALQQSIANLAATIVFMLFQPFRLGELIDANGVLGTVKEIQLFSTVLVTGDNKEITIPNSMIQSNNLVNYTRLGRLRVDFVFSVSYADDVRKVKEVLNEILAADERVLAEPAPVIFCAVAGRKRPEHRRAAVGRARRLLDAAMGPTGAGQVALRRRGHHHTISAERRTPGWARRPRADQGLICCERTIFGCRFSFSAPAPNPPAAGKLHPQYTLMGLSRPADPC